jgi:hypothetical protein
MNSGTDGSPPYNCVKRIDNVGNGAVGALATFRRTAPMICIETGTLDDGGTNGNRKYLTSNVREMNGRRRKSILRKLSEA